MENIWSYVAPWNHLRGRVSRPAFAALEICSKYRTVCFFSRNNPLDNRVNRMPFVRYSAGRTFEIVQVIDREFK